jgi:hypothetical protein
VGISAVIGREIAHQAHAPGVRGCGESCHGLITAKQRNDLTEGRGVVAMV